MMTKEAYTKDHEWARLDKDKAICGISDFAQQALGDVVYVELPALGRAVKAGEQLAVVESVKAASEVYAPMDGVVIAVNESLANNPALVNSDPLGAGWFFKIQPSAPEQHAKLMDLEAYEKFRQG
jgi:glycine cleavage system H protein